MNTIIAKLSTILQDLKRRLLLMIAIGKVRYVNDSQSLAQMQIEAMPGEVHDAVVSFGHYGLATRPHPGADAIVLFPGGERSQGIVIAIEDKRFRFKSLEPGEVALYTDEGDHIYFRRNQTLEIQTRTLRIKATEKVHIESPLLEVTGDIVDQVGQDGKSMAKMRAEFEKHRHVTDDGTETSAPITLK